MDKKDFGYKLNQWGYQVQYKENNIGGAGTSGQHKMHWKNAKANLSLYRRYAQSEIDKILSGNGRKDMLTVIKTIDKIN